MRCGNLSHVKTKQKTNTHIVHELVNHVSQMKASEKLNLSEANLQEYDIEEKHLCDCIHTGN